MQQRNGIAAPGAIIWEEAYAQAKMLDHSGWSGILDRRITPSDVDFAFDNRNAGGAIIYGELSSSCREWAQLQSGQREFYENCIRDRHHCAVLCKHSVRPEHGRKINTFTDIESFQVMVWDHGPVYSHAIVGNQHWQSFVVQWVNRSDGPMRARQRVLGKIIRTDVSQHVAVHPDFIDGATS